MRPDKGVDCKVKVCANNGTWARLVLGRVRCVCRIHDIIEGEGAEHG